MSSIVVLPSFSITPNKAVSYNSIFIKDKATNTLKRFQELNKTKVIKFSNKLESNKIKRSFHNFAISQNAYRTLKTKISWLYYLASKKSVKTKSGKSIFNFKIGFITLTLPVKQEHNTAYITKHCLNQFLTEVRELTGMCNYVWRLEFQKNGNVHYHIVTDTYIDYYIIRKIWNRQMYKIGYIQKYQNKMSKLTLLDYNKIYNKDNKVDFKVIKERYLENVKSNWANPPSVDVKSVVSDKSIANYISKYFAKSDTNAVICNPLDNEENSKGLRIWFCSRSLSKLDKISNFCEAVNYDIFALISYGEKVLKLTHKYCTVYYFEIFTMPKRVKDYIDKLLRNYAKGMHYKPWEPLLEL